MADQPAAPALAPEQVARIRGNVQKMLSQSAPEADVDAYLSSEGITADALRAARPQPSVPADVAKSFGTGLANAGIGIAGMPGDAMDLGATVVDKFASKQQPGPAAMPKATGGLPPSDDRLLPGSKEIRSYVEGRFGKLYEPQTVYGEFAKTTGEMVPNAVLPGGAARRVANVLLPAIASESAGQATKGTPYEPYARVAGGVAAFPTVSGRVITPLPASAERNRFVQNLANEGVTSLTAGQRTGNKGLQWFEQAASDMPLGGGGATRITNEGKEQFTQAALRRVGENANRADDITMDRALTRIGNEFDRLSTNNDLAADMRLGGDLNNAYQNYVSRVAPTSQVPIVENTLRDIMDYIRNQGGVITGRQYQDMRTRLNTVARETNDPTLSRTLFDIQHALDDTMERSLQRAGNHADLEAWRTARREYRNMIPLERAATGAGADTAEGFISPSQLRNAVVAQNPRAYARGDGDFAQLARSGEAVMKPLPNSGTAPRTLAQNLMSGSVAIGGLGVPSLAGRAVTSWPVQQYLGNQLLAPVLHGSRPARDIAVQLLMSEPRLQLQSPP